MSKTKFQSVKRLIKHCNFSWLQAKNYKTTSSKIISRCICYYKNYLQSFQSIKNYTAAWQQYLESFLRTIINNFWKILVQIAKLFFLDFLYYYYGVWSVFVSDWKKTSNLSYFKLLLLQLQITTVWKNLEGRNWSCVPNSLSNNMYQKLSGVIFNLLDIFDLFSSKLDNPDLSIVLIFM